MTFENTLFTDISLCRNDEYLVCSHSEATFSVVRLADNNVEPIELNFGDCDTVWGVEVMPLADGAEDLT